MANPDLTSNGNSILGKYISSLATTTLTSILANSSSSGKVYKINSITVSNVTTGTTAWVSVWRGTQSNTVNGPYGTSSLEGYLAYQIDIPPKATLSILGKSTSIYLNEGHNIIAVSNQNSTLNFSASFEVIS